MKKDISKRKWLALASLVSVFFHHQISAEPLVNISYNGPVAGDGIALGFIVDQAGEFVILIEGFPFESRAAIGNPVLELKRLGGENPSIVANDDCAIDIAAVINRSLATAKDACAIVQLEPGAYAVLARDADGGSGNVLASVTETSAF